MRVPGVDFLTRQPLVLRLTQEVQASATTRRGLLAAAAILWVYGLLVLSDARGPMREKLGQVEDRLATAIAEQREQAWPARELAARQQLAALHSIMWRAENAGIAEAALRDWIQEGVRSSGVTLHSLTVQAVDTHAAANATAPVESSASQGAKPASLPEGVTRVRAHLTMDFTPQTWSNLLLRLESATYMVTVERFAVHNMTPGGTAELDIEALFLGQS